MDPVAKASWLVFFWGFSVLQKYLFFFFSVQFKISSGIRQNVSLINPRWHSPSLLQILSWVSWLSPCTSSCPLILNVLIYLEEFSPRLPQPSWGHDSRSSYPWAAACTGTQSHPFNLRSQATFKCCWTDCRRDCQRCQLNAEQSHGCHLLVITAEEKMPLFTVKNMARHAQLTHSPGIKWRKGKTCISLSLFINLSVTHSRAPCSISDRCAKACRG